MKIDWRFGSGLKWNQLLTYFYFFFFSFLCALSCHLSPTKFHISRASLLTSGSGLWSDHLQCRISNNRSGSPQGAVREQPLACPFHGSAGHRRTHPPPRPGFCWIFFAVVFTSCGALTFLEEPEGFILPPFRKITLSPGVVMWLR